VRRMLTTFGTIAVAAALVAGCGGDDTTGAASGGEAATTTAAAPATTQDGGGGGGGGRGGDYGYGDGGGGGSGGQAGAGAVEIANFAFAPGSRSVKVGDSVKWTNQDGATHTVTADDGAFDSGNLANGKSFSFTFDQAGTFAYHCNIHQSMTGKVTVTG
jgi:plastocyanin